MKRLTSIVLACALVSAAHAGEAEKLDAEFRQSTPERKVHICAGGFAAVSEFLIDWVRDTSLVNGRLLEASRDTNSLAAASSVALTILAKRQEERALAPLMTSRWHSRIRTNLDDQASYKDVMTWVHETCRPLLQEFMATAQITGADIDEVANPAGEKADERFMAAMKANAADSAERANRAMDEFLKKRQEGRR